MNRLNSLYDVTVKLQELVTSKIPDEERQEKIDKVNSLLKERQVLLNEIKPPYTEEEKVVGKRLLPINEEIQQNLGELFNQVKTDMATVKKKKDSNNKYMNPYKSLSNFDGMFMDHKK
ncbi:flagellar protein FliT [Aquibacillus rhizosphaerae]|uniref:Flagellar protein FliT n=1 Tax=Aquibacillus rhizosphaerae TaxID=3051431 RepID=A0ABT7L3P8_9BACI|nr:flagellar protein FliT [Aquibacillus sp. LR5S19]MDL4839230.1 flagellar protein FliT [Aquibacillus sp. LR5S19]